MSSDLSQRFEQLRREPLGIGLPDPEALRRVGTRRRRGRRVAAAGVAAAAVAVVALTLNGVLPSPQGVTPPPGLRSPTPGPTPTWTMPTATPVPSPTRSLIPDSAFPSLSTIAFADMGAVTPAPTLLPELCGLVSIDVDGVRDLTDATTLVENRWRQAMIDVPDPPGEHFPEGTMDVQILLFDEGGANRFLESLRTAVATCRTDPQARWGPITFTAVTGAPRYGDDTFTFIGTRPYPVQPNSSETVPCEDLYEVIRVRQAVMVADVNGWETCYADPALDRELRDAAITTFLDWASSI